MCRLAQPCDLLARIVRRQSSEVPRDDRRGDLRACGGQRLRSAGLGTHWPFALLPGLGGELGNIGCELGDLERHPRGAQLGTIKIDLLRARFWVRAGAQRGDQVGDRFHVFVPEGDEAVTESRG